MRLYYSRRMARPRQRAADPTKAVLYVRVSTEDQNLGPEAQRVAMARWCADHGIAAVGVFEDLGVSGGTSIERRPGLLAALDAVRLHGAGVLLVAKRDRLARDPIVAAMAEASAARLGAKIASVAGEGCDGDDPASVLLRRMVDAFSEYERSLIRARTRAALRVKKGRGERVGGVPFGFCVGPDGRSLVPDPGEQATIDRIRVLRAHGATLNAIARTLGAERVPCRGARWHATTIMRVIAREAA